jgi:hypothetical protein
VYAILRPFEETFSTLSTINCGLTSSTLELNGCFTSTSCYGYVWSTCVRVDDPRSPGNDQLQLHEDAAPSQEAASWTVPTAHHWELPAAQEDAMDPVPGMEPEVWRWTLDHLGRTDTLHHR